MSGDVPQLVDRLARYTERGWSMRLNSREVRSLVVDTPRDRIAFLGGAVVARLIRACWRQSGIRMSLSEVRAAAHRARRLCRHCGGLGNVQKAAGMAERCDRCAGTGIVPHAATERQPGGAS